MGEHSISNRLAVDQPTRGADRNRSLADQADPATDEMLLPQLDDGITLLDVEGGRGVPILQSLVLDHLLLHDGPAFWVDANGHATTTLAQIAPIDILPSLGEWDSSGGDIGYAAPTEASFPVRVLRFVRSSLGLALSGERDNSDQIWSSHVRRTGRAIDPTSRFTPACRSRNVRDAPRSACPS